MTAVPAGPEFFAIAPDGARAYVTTDESDGVTVIDIAGNVVIGTIPTGQRPTRIAFTPDGAMAYVTNLLDNSVTVIDTASLTVVSTLTGFACPGGIAIGLVLAPPVPTTKDDCKAGGYARSGWPAGPFRNQGQCVAFVERHSAPGQRALPR